MSDEQTILENASDTRKLLNMLESDLNRALRRGVEKDESVAPRPENPSIVGEIIELMQENNQKIVDLSRQIRLEVLIKLDRTDNPKS